MMKVVAGVCPALREMDHLAHMAGAVMYVNHAKKEIVKQVGLFAKIGLHVKYES